MNNGFTGTITSTATFNNDVQTREIDFIYDHNGMRTGKIVSENGKTETTEYTLHGKLITHLTKRTVDENGNATTQELHFFYDAQSRPAFVEYEGTMYRYIYNLQGDVVAIVDTAGNPVVEYKYDAWGNDIGEIERSTIGEISPFKYRGYVYDGSVNLYCLQSRCYNAHIMRFINSDILIDGILDISGKNVFVYCVNNPIDFIDPTGCRYIEGADIAGDPQKSNKLWFTGNGFIFKGKFFRYAKGKRPPSPTGAYLSAIPKIIAQGKGCVLYRNTGNEIQAQVGRYALDSKGILSLIKDCHGRVEVDIKIKRDGNGVDYAGVVFHKYQYVTNDPLGVGLGVHGEEDSGVMVLLRLTSDGGYFLIDNRIEFLYNEDDWITRALDEVVMQ